MMAILEKKIGSKSHVITCIIYHVKNFQFVSTNQDLIDFVDQLELVKLDLESYGHIKGMAKTPAIREIKYMGLIR